MNQEFVDELENKIANMINNVHTAIPGVIKSFDANTCTATVLPFGTYNLPDGSEIAYPLIPGVPVVIQQYANQKAVIAFPIKKDDGCLIIFSEQQLDSFLYGSSTSELHHDMTNAIAIVGLCKVSSNAIKDACTKDAIVIYKNDTEIDVYDDKIDVQTTEININASSVNVTAIDKVHINGNVEIDGELSVSNVSTVSSLITGPVVASYITANAVTSPKFTTGALEMTEHRHMLSDGTYTGKPTK